MHARRLYIFERQGFWLANELDVIAARFNPADPAVIELHGNPNAFMKKTQKTPLTHS